MNTLFTYLTGATKTKQEEQKLDAELNQLSQRGSEYQETVEETKSQKMKKKIGEIEEKRIREEKRKDIQGKETSQRAKEEG